jgi:hypothetical protein
MNAGAGCAVLVGEACRHSFNKAKASPFRFSNSSIRNRAMFRLSSASAPRQRLTPSSLGGSQIPRRGWQNSRRDSHRGCARGDVGDDQRVRGNHGPIANGHRANDGTVAANEDVVAYGGSTWPRPRADRAYVVDCAIGPDLGVTMHSHQADMRNEQAWANLSVRMNVNMRYHRK